jgi:hypothetical protein
MFKILAKENVTAEICKLYNANVKLCSQKPEEGTEEWKLLDACINPKDWI